jgi:group II intron reverse transcriptase/maturase
MFAEIVDAAHLEAAWRRVRENQGCAGVDGVTIEEFESGVLYELARLHRELTDGSYRPLPLLRILVDKGNGEARALCIPTVRDRVAQAAALQLIEPVLEAQFEDCSFAYRKGRSVRQAVHRIKALYEKGYRWVVDADIDAFFDSLDHDLLMAKIDHFIADEWLRSLLRLWIQAEVWDGETVTGLERGIPQGSVISPILANLFLDDLDEELLRRGLKLVRYADDFVILSKERAEAEAALEVTDKILELLGLALDEEKTAIVHFDHGFKYLGVMFVRSLIMVPFEKASRERRVLYIPPPLDLAAYREARDRGRSREDNRVRGRDDRP